MLSPTKYSASTALAISIELSVLVGSIGSRLVKALGRTRCSHEEAPRNDSALGSSADSARRLSVSRLSAGRALALEELKPGHSGSAAVSATRGKSGIGQGSARLSNSSSIALGDACGSSASRLSGRSALGRLGRSDGWSAAARLLGSRRTRSSQAQRLSALGSRLSALGSRLSALGSRLSALGSRLSALGSRLSALGSRLSALMMGCTDWHSICQALNPAISPLFPRPDNGNRAAGAAGVSTLT